MARGLVSAGTLYVVATPLGNLGDLSDRARDVLRAVGLVAAEDTRRTRVLLEHIGAGPRLVSYHAHSPPKRQQHLLARLAAGEDVALVTDAGTPTVSDPGARLVALVRDAGGPVVPIPGPSAVTTALSVSGLPADRYLFLGFLPRRGREREALVTEIAESPRTVVLFEAAPRLARLLADLVEACGGERAAAVGRELTKLHEELKTGTLNELQGYYGDRAPRGEVTIVIGPAGTTAAAADAEAAEARARTLLADGLSRRDVAIRVGQEFGVSKREAYSMVTRL